MVFVCGHHGLKKSINAVKKTENVSMKTKNTLVKRGALIAVLILGSGTWVSAQITPSQSGGQTGGQPPGQNGGQTPGQTEGQTPGQIGGQTPGQTPGQIGGYQNGAGRQQTNDTTSSYSSSNTNTNSTASASISSQSMQTKKVNKGSVLIGTAIRNQQGEELGKIRDLVIDFSGDRVAYVVVANKTGLFGAQKLHAVPLQAFQPDADGTSLILNADKDKFERSAGFDKDNWPAMSSAAWGAEPMWKDYQGTNSSQSGHQGATNSLYQHKGDNTDSQNRLDRNTQDTTTDPSRIDPLSTPRR